MQSVVHMSHVRFCRINLETFEAGSMQWHQLDSQHIRSCFELEVFSTGFYFAFAATWNTDRRDRNVRQGSAHFDTICFFKLQYVCHIFSGSLIELSNPCNICMKQQLNAQFWALQPGTVSHQMAAWCSSSTRYLPYLFPALIDLCCSMFIGCSVFETVYFVSQLVS